MRILAQKIVHKMLSEPREALKRAAKNSEWDNYARVVNDLFGFDRKDSKSGAPTAESAKPPDEIKT